MGLRLAGQEFEDCFFVTTTFHEKQRLGNEAGVFEEVVKAIEIQKTKHQLKLISYVLMPSHFHLVIVGDGGKISNFMRDVKKYTAQKSLRQYEVDGKLWQDRYDRVALWTEAVLRTKVEYCHMNPARAGLVQEPEDWYWSSAADYAGIRRGPLPIWIDWI